jgi:hypothetical protein
LNNWFDAETFRNSIENNCCLFRNWKNEIDISLTEMMKIVIW